MDTYHAAIAVLAELILKIHANNIADKSQFVTTGDIKGEKAGKNGYICEPG
jgi:hypothetical protein